MATKEIVTTTIRLPRGLWIKLRRLQEEGKIESIHQACIDGLGVVVAQVEEKEVK